MAGEILYVTSGFFGRGAFFSFLPPLVPLPEWAATASFRRSGLAFLPDFLPRLDSMGTESRPMRPNPHTG